MMHRTDEAREGAAAMALRHAVLAALLDGEYSGYQLAKVFDISVANFWPALPQQLYAELAKLEKDGLVAGREVVQETRPNKRLFHVTDAGRAALEEFAAPPRSPRSSATICSSRSRPPTASAPFR